MFLYSAMIRGTRKNPPCSLRRLRQHDLAVEARRDDVVALDVARLDHLRSRGDGRHVELRQRIDVLEQVAKLRRRTVRPRRR